jgi:phosphatidyl-myo-inositol alpha-mannosyltransferase
MFLDVLGSTLGRVAGAVQFSAVRIGIFSPYSLTLPGGVQGQVLGLARALRRRGHVVRVLGPCDGPPPDAGVTPLGNSIPTAANGSVAPIAPDASAALRTIRALADEDFDLIHLHEPYVPGPNATAVLTATCPMIATYHAAGRSSSYRYLGRPITAASKRIAMHCAVSDDAEVLVRDVLGPGVHVELLFNGVEVERFANATEYKDLGSGPIVFFVGRHEERKGLGVLLEAHRMLDRPDVRVWVAGNGPQTAELQQRFRSPQISWLGRISDRELAQRWKAADVYCAPSMGGESFGVVLLESMAAGTPVVASDIDGYRNVVTPDLDGLIVPPGDPAALSTALRCVLDDPVLASQLVAAGEVRAAAYSMDNLAARYELLYERLLAAHTPRRRSRRWFPLSTG